MPETVAGIIKRFIERAHAVPADVARAVDVSPSWLYMILSGDRLPTEELVDALAGPLRLTPEEHQELRDATTYERADPEQKKLLNKYRARLSRPPSHVTDIGGIPVIAIPVLSTCPGGDPMSYHNDYPPEVAPEYVPVPADFLLAHPQAFALRIQGESMSPKYLSDSYVVGSPDELAEPGHAAIVCLDGGAEGIEITCKLWQATGEHVVLSPVNPEFAPLVVPCKRVRWALRVIFHMGRE